MFRVLLESNDWRYRNGVSQWGIAMVYGVSQWGISIAKAGQVLVEGRLNGLAGPASWLGYPAWPAGWMGWLTCLGCLAPKGVLIRSIEFSP